MDAFITALTGEIQPTDLWGVLVGGVAIIALAVLFGFGYRVVRRIIAGLGKGKAKI